MMFQYVLVQSVILSKRFIFQPGIVDKYDIGIIFCRLNVFDKRLQQS